MRLMTLPAVGGRAASMVSRPVHVCFVIDRLGRAGTESQLLALLENLDRARIQPSLCLLNGADAISRSLLPDNCPTIDLRLEKLTRPAAIVAAVRLAGFWRRQRVDVVQTYFLDSTYFAVPLARLCGIRQIVRVRNNTGYWQTPTHRWLGRVLGRLCRVTLTNSEDGRQAVLGCERLAPDRVQVLENGIDLARFPDIRPPNTGQATVRIGVVANLRPVKNIDGLIRVAANLCRQNTRVHFVVAGEGPSRQGLEEEIRTAGLGSRFRLMGAVDDVPAFLASVDVAVLCSHSESMSNAILEYMAAGRAIVATDVGANARLVRDGREGLIVPPRDEKALAQGILRLLSDPPLALELGAAARRRAGAAFSRAAMVRRFEDFFVSLVK
jgi:glycosyltransferase involved in cell wall biosynthesis